MSKQKASGKEQDTSDDDVLFYDEDFEVEEFVETQELEPAMTRTQRRLASLRRVEERREQKWLESQLKDWDDYED